MVEVDQFDRMTSCDPALDRYSLKLLYPYLHHLSLMLFKSTLVHQCILEFVGSQSLVARVSNGNDL